MGVLTIGKSNALEFNENLLHLYDTGEKEPLKDCLKKCIRTMERVGETQGEKEEV